jgi:peroxiredoxin
VKSFWSPRISARLFVLPIALLLGIGYAQAQDDFTAKPPDTPPILPIGSAAPDFNLPGIDGKSHSLKDYAEAKVLAIVFTCNHCPVAQMYEKRIKQLTSDYRDKGVAVVAINPNAPNAVHLSEMGYTDLGDSLGEMKIRAQYRHFNFPYLSDGENQKVALKYGPVATPHVFVFDKERKLRYEGRVDSNPREELATKHEARDAIDALLAGKPVAVEHAPAVGCSTKWAYKEAGTKAELAKEAAEPVTVELTSAEQLKAIRKNAGTGKLLLVNFWATWCGPCVGEFPELQKMVRQFRARQINIVTLSVNAPDEKDMVLSFLKKEHALNRNLLFNSNDAAEAAPAFNAGWTGAVPYTVLIGMNGELLYHSQGAMDPIEVKRAILKHLPDDNYKGQNAYWNSSF